mmetsp:Transcript_36794/g.92495  ORF Transcript_36794/g.92495 Transcript_36794/m.92495 type:complete len:151 (-) Transcript_36794:251-703(-)
MRREAPPCVGIGGGTDHAPRIRARVPAPILAPSGCLQRYVYCALRVRPRVACCRQEAWGSKVRQDLPSTVCWSFAVWAPAHFINFLYVPPHLRVVYTNMVFFSWTVFLSYVGYRPPVQPTPQGDSMPCITPPSSKLGPAGVVSRVSLGGA